MRYIIRRYRSATWKSIRISRRRDIMYTRRHSCTKHTQPRVMLFNKNSSQHYTHHSHHTSHRSSAPSKEQTLLYAGQSPQNIQETIVVYMLWPRAVGCYWCTIYNECTRLAEHQQSFKHPRILYNLKVNGLYSRRRRPHIKKQTPYRLSPVELVGCDLNASFLTFIIHHTSSASQKYTVYNFVCDTLSIRVHCVSVSSILMKSLPYVVQHWCQTLYVSGYIVYSSWLVSRESSCCLGGSITMEK